MKKILPMTFVLFLALTAAHAQDTGFFDRFFVDKTMRLDYFHTGIHNKEIYSYDEIFQEPLWPGSKTNLVDTLNLGKYLFQVFDIQTNQLIYSRGFSSIFGEWQTIGEAHDSIWRTFSESIRFPWPKKPVKVTIGTQDDKNVFYTDWSYVIDPAKWNIRKTTYFEDAKVTAFVKSGDPSQKVDLVLLPDGYTQKEMGKFRKDAKRLLDILFEISPFKEQKKDFNVWGVEVPSMESGVDNPRKHKFVDNAFGTSYNAFDLDRYALSWENKTIRKAAARAPYDYICILVNDPKYGGGGIYNLYATVAVDDQYSGYVFVHELGHSFAGLGDEYYSSSVAYNDFYPPGVEPWEPNVTALLDKDHVKCQHLMEKDTPLPTPWAKTEYENKMAEFGAKRRKAARGGASKTELDRLSREASDWEFNFFRSQADWGKVGAYQGACYASEGLYRPFLDCIMFTKTLDGFDPVCSDAIKRMIDFYAQ